MSDYGPSPLASLSAAAVAELHLKMSKKIAQLTKVIFHLNTRNEDFQADVAYLKQLHAFELQQLTQDAASKLKALQTQLQGAEERAASAEQRVATDKQQFLRDLGVFQQQAAAQHSALQLEFQRHVQRLEDQVEQSRLAFVSRIQQLTQAAEAQRQQLQSSSSASSAALQRSHREAMEALQQRHSDEVSELVTSANAKYNAMLAEQLRLRDALKAEHDAERRQWEQTREAAQSHAQQQLATAQARFDEHKQQLVGKMETLLADAEALRADETKLRREKEELLRTQSELQRQIKMLELQLTKAQQDTLSVRKDADARASTLQQSLTLSAERVEQLGREADALKLALAARDQALQSALQARDALQMELLQGSASLSERSAQFQQQLSEHGLRVAALQDELEQSRRQAAASDAQQRQRITELEAALAAKEKELRELQQKLSSLELLRSNAARDKERVEAELAAQLRSAEQALVTLRDQHARERDALQRSTADALETQQRETAARLAAMETQLQQQSTAARDKLLRDAEAKHASEMAELRRSTDSVASQLRQELATRQADLQATQAQLSQQEKALAESMTKARELAAKLQQSDERASAVEQAKAALQTTAQKREREREEAFAKQLKDATSQHETAMKRLASERDKLVAEHRQALAQLRREHAEALETARREWLAASDERLQQVEVMRQQAHDDAIAAMQSEMEAQRLASERAMAELLETTRERDERQQMESEGLRGRLCALEARHVQRTRELEAYHLEKHECQLVSHTQEIERLSAKLRAERDAMVRRLTDDAEQKRSELTTRHQNEMEALRQQHATETKSTQDALTAQRHSEALALRTEMAQKLRELRAQKEQEQARALQDAQSRHDAELTPVRQRAEMLEKTLAQRTSELESSRQNGERLSSTLDAKTREMQDRVTTLERRHREDVEELKLAAKRDMDRLLEENLRETKLLSEQFEETRRIMTDKVAFLQQTIADWEDRYARRESRAEDVARIAELERLVAEKDALVRQTLDEMAYFKRELLNREEMYNKTFSRTPNVGVLNVLKPHVALQAQLTQQQGPTTPSPLPPNQSQTPLQSRRRTKPSAVEGGHAGSNSSRVGGSATDASVPELQRRASERAKKSLPPLSNNQIAL
ncbi:hypothetical protein P43SY_004310 [Pythium insidiosum]|uniref:Protein FAM184A/B N-terminal domain-containing protein n=1 Tax=Pythium insidiosum TaxID=114742 RepID=A0AAD5QCB0_PYTIN|nr:hypothetical protein P43SY_004310 [Pythium insidiosum]